MFPKDPSQHMVPKLKKQFVAQATTNYPQPDWRANDCSTFFLPHFFSGILCANHSRTTVQTRFHFSPLTAMMTELDTVLWKELLSSWLHKSCFCATGTPTHRSIIAAFFSRTLTSPAIQSSQALMGLHEMFFLFRLANMFSSCVYKKWSFASLYFPRIYFILFFFLWPFFAWLVNCKWTDIIQGISNAYLFCHTEY